MAHDLSLVSCVWEKSLALCFAYRSTALHPLSCVERLTYLSIIFVLRCGSFERGEVVKKVAKERKPRETETGKTTELKQVCASSVTFTHWRLPLVQLVRRCVFWPSRLINCVGGLGSILVRSSWFSSPLCDSDFRAGCHFFSLSLWSSGWPLPHSPHTLFLCECPFTCTFPQH